MSVQSNGIKRGVSLYSYAGEFGVTMTLEDMLADVHDMDVKGIEILGNSHVLDYPHPSEAWLEKWDKMLMKYDLIPVEYGHWVDSRLYKGRELTTEESVEMLKRDFKIANRLGFTILRTKLGVIDDDLTPVKNWREFIKRALPLAEKYNVRMCPEIHEPTLLKSKMVDDYIDFIEKTGTKYFGLNIDFSVFRTGELSEEEKEKMGFKAPPMEHSQVDDIIPLLPYVYCCHAKFFKMTEECQAALIPYDEIISVLQEHKWEGYLLSEYEGPYRDVPGYTSQQLRRQHVMLKRLLGE